MCSHAINNTDLNCFVLFVVHDLKMHRKLGWDFKNNYEEPGIDFGPLEENSIMCLVQLSK